MKIIDKIMDIWFKWSYCVMCGNKKEKAIGTSLLMLVIAFIVVGLVMQYA